MYDVCVYQVAVRVRPLRADEGPRIVHVVSDKVTAFIYSTYNVNAR